MHREIGKPLRVNLPNKRWRQTETLLNAASLINQEFPGTEPCLHYSIKNMSGGTQGFRDFCTRAAKIPHCSVLLVSGSGKRAFDSCACLEELASTCTAADLPPIGVVFSPYEPSAVEQGRLLRKLQTGLVNDVWMQLGSNLNMLRSGLEFLNQFVPGQVSNIYGSIFLPTPALLAKQKARPWTGVYLSPEFLSSTDAATHITKQQLKLFADFGVTPLIESPVEKLAQCQQLLELMNCVCSALPQQVSGNTARRECSQRVPGAQQWKRRLVPSNQRWAKLAGWEEVIDLDHDSYVH